MPAWKNDAIIMVNYSSIKFNTSFTDIFISCDNNRQLAILCNRHSKIDLHKIIQKIPSI